MKITRIALAPSFAVALLAAACGGGDDGAASTTTTSSTTTGTGSTSTAAGGAGTGGATSAGGAGGAGGTTAAGGAGGATGVGGAGGAPSGDSLLVPGGSFLRQNLPELPATVSAYRLDKHEFTVARMRAYLATLAEAERATIAGQLADCEGATWTADPGTNEDKPINCVTKAIAEAACKGVGQRLPTELEWEFAAAGGEQQRTYPWSDPASDTTIDATHAVYAGQGPDTIAAVGSKPAGAGRWGHLDLGGNVWEIVLDTDNQGYVTEPVCDDCSFVDPLQDRYMRRGGGFESSPDRLLVASRDSDPDDGFPNKGFRCADEP